MHMGCGGSSPLRGSFCHVKALGVTLPGSLRLFINKMRTKLLHRRVKIYVKQLY